MSARRDDDDITLSAHRERRRRERHRARGTCVRCGLPAEINTETWEHFTACLACRREHSRQQFMKRRGIQKMSPQMREQWLRACKLGAS